MIAPVDPQVLKEQFIGWQCRIRQYAVRKGEGRPCPGMRPSLELQGQNPSWVNVQIVKTNSDDVTREFQFMIQKTQDPRDRYNAAIKLLSEYYYQIPSEFDEEMTAVYSVGSEVAEQIVSTEQCLLRFDQGNQVYNLVCRARFIETDDAKHQATYWHNHLFNPAMPGSVQVVGFLPDWTRSTFNTGR